MLKSSIFVIPSRYEGFPNVLGEAMLAGLPVIGFRNVSGVNELILHKNNGFLIDQNNAIFELEHYIVDLINNKIKRIKFGKFSAEYIKKWNSNRILNIWQNLFEECLKNY